MEEPVVCPEHGEFPCMIIEDQPISCAVAGATRWLDGDTYRDPNEAEWLILLLRNELVKSWQRNTIMGECIKQHLMEQSALCNVTAQKVYEA